MYTYKEYNILGKDEKNIQDKVFDHLIKHKLIISSAESCTGGAFAKSITDRAGASDIFKLGFVTYSNEAKMSQLGVKEDTLNKYTAVSAETALEMVSGLKKVTGADICISVTGYAGPGKGERGEDPGLVYIGISYKNKTAVKEYHDDGGSRDHVRVKTVNDIYKLIYDVVIDAD